MNCCFQKNMFMGLCAENYDTLDGLMNGVDGTFKDFTNLFKIIYMDTIL
jgi:hypothetical protein